MNLKTKIYTAFALFFLCFSFLKAQKITVAQDGSGNFKSIQAAINSLPDSSVTQRVIFIKKGVYREKVLIEKHNILLKGENNASCGKSWGEINSEETTVTASKALSLRGTKQTQEGVKIIYSISREIFRCTAPDDWGAGVMNIRAKDVTLENLIVVNDFGFTAKGDSTFICDGKSKITRKDGHQFALRCMPLTQRLTAKNCNFHSYGGDTVSPWDVDNGTFYFKNCTMEGAVDFYCPRGWAYAEGCYFICHNMNAAIWHDGTGTESAKTVLKNCTFVGDKGYKLGRFHRDAQFYLVNCTFSKDMADADIYKNSKDTVLRWEKRVNYYNCHHEGGDFAWHKNNIDASLAKKINFDWTLKERWNLAPQPTKTKSDYGLPKVADAPKTTQTQQITRDEIAERMIIAQRSVGGWAKTLDGKTQPPPYDKEWDPTLIASITDETGRNDATIDNNATVREISHLAKAFNETSNEKYKNAAEKGIEYLLKMQYPNGGFPQFYPDSSIYRKHITYNDNAMTRALDILKDISISKSPFEKVGVAYREKAKQAVEKGIDCILKTQIIVNGEPTIWCAQHHYQTLEPIKARAFELASFSGSESVGIIEFLMKIDLATLPSDRDRLSVKKAISSGVAFLDKLKLKGIKTERIKDAALPVGEDVVVREDANANPIWARFYDLDTQKPFFCGRDGIKKATLAEIENERRAHYAWYGNWAEKLLTKDYPKWVAKWGKE
jgi:PelA/Pel-15E family pectate lyase